MSNANSKSAASEVVSAAFTVRLKLCGQVIDVGVASGDSVTTTATAVAEAINDAADLPYTAQNSSGVVTITAKHQGPRGNTLIVDAYFVSSTGSETRITASSTSSGAGTTGVWTTVTTESTEYHLQAGATQDSIATVLTNIEPAKYDRIVIANIDSTNVGRLVTALNAQAAVTGA
jgi:phage tail sheath gpL-like